MARKTSTKTQFGIKTGTVKVKTNQNMPKEDRQYFTDAELAVIDSGEMEIDEILWSSDFEEPLEIIQRPTVEEAAQIDDDQLAQNLIMWFARTKITSNNGKKLPPIGRKQRRRSEFSENDTILFGNIQEMTFDIQEEDEE
jgi:hypothetical protein